MSGLVFLGRYETIRLLGEGGMGKVYLARHLELEEPVVVKVMHERIATNPVFRERFKREMKLMARFKHPNTVVLHDATLEDPQGPCIVMEFLPGVSLDRLLAENVRFSATRLHRFLNQLCDVLQAAHEQGIVHRDLKPANLMVLDADTPHEKLKVMDFGLAQMVQRQGQGQGPQDLKSTVQREFAVGTPGYMAPEQVSGDEVDHRADLYSVGAILYQLLTGRVPFPGSTVMEILMAQATDPLPTFASIGMADKVPAGVEEVVRWALSIKPEDRPQSARELFEAYEQAVTANFRPPTAPAAAPVPAPAQTPMPVPVTASGATIEHLEAYMPEQMAVYKLEGFVEEVGGKIIESKPGLIRMQLRVNRNALDRGSGGLLSWLGLGPKYALIDMELHLQKKDTQKQSVLQITVMMRPAGGGPAPNNPDWLSRCQIITTALKGYLMSQG